MNFQMFEVEPPFCNYRNGSKPSFGLDFDNILGTQFGSEDYSLQALGDDGLEPLFWNTDSPLLEKKGTRREREDHLSSSDHEECSEKKCRRSVAVPQLRAGLCFNAFDEVQILVFKNGAMCFRSATVLDRSDNLMYLVRFDDDESEACIRADVTFPAREDEL